MTEDRKEIAEMSELNFFPDISLLEWEFRWVR